MGRFPVISTPQSTRMLMHPFARVSMLRLHSGDGEITG